MTKLTCVAATAALLLIERPPEITDAELAQLATVIDGAYERAVGYREDLDEQVKLAMIAQLPSREARFMVAQAYASVCYSYRGCDPDLIKGVFFDFMVAHLAPAWWEPMNIDHKPLADGGLTPSKGWSWRGRLGRVRPVEASQRKRAKEELGVVL